MTLYQTPTVATSTSPGKLIALNFLLKTFTKSVDVRKSRFAAKAPDL